MSCVLRATGRDFDVDSFLHDSSLTPLIVYHRGARRFPDSKMVPDEQSGMNVAVSECDLSNVTGQINDAMSFLQNYKDELRRLRNYPGWQRLALDFPIAYRDAMIESDTFPAVLISLMAELEIGLVV